MCECDRALCAAEDNSGCHPYDIKGPGVASQKPKWHPCRDLRVFRSSVVQNGKWTTECGCRVMSTKRELQQEDLVHHEGSDLRTWTSGNTNTFHVWSGSHHHFMTWLPQSSLRLKSGVFRKPAYFLRLAPSPQLDDVCTQKLQPPQPPNSHPP